MRRHGGSEVMVSPHDMATLPYVAPCLRRFMWRIVTLVYLTPFPSRSLVAPKQFTLSLDALYTLSIVPAIWKDIKANVGFNDGWRKK